MNETLFGCFNGNIEQNEVGLQKNEVSIAWRNLGYEVGEYGGLGKKKAILRNLNGSFEYHSLNAFMGPSGAGKTTLLNCLSGNDRSGLTNESEIYLNSSEKSSISYFITQHVHESIVGRMRVLDIFRYAYRFKNGSSAIGRMDEHISTVMAELILPVDILSRHFAQCSGGEQKRIAIGQELMALNKPTFLFVDEPTTGLDSAAAFEVMKCLKQLTVKHRMTIIASIHVPSNEILNLFDKLYVLSKGVCIYSGLPNQIESYLQVNQLKIVGKRSPIEALIQISCNQNQTISQLENHCFQSEQQKISSNPTQLNLLPNGLPNTRKHFSVNDFFLQTCRQFSITFISNFQTFISLILFHMFNMILLSTFFSHDMVKPNGCYSLNPNDTNCEDDFEKNALINENVHYLIFSAAIVGYAMITTNTVLFSPLVKVFRNEHRNKWYSLGVFYWPVNLVSILELTCYSVVIATFAYFCTEQHAADQYQINWNRLVQFIFCVWLNSFYSQSLGQMFGVIILNSIVLSIVLSTMVYTFMDIMNDFFFKTDEFDNWLLVQFANVVGLKYVTRYMFYVFYGIDRCEEETEFSLMLAKNFVKREDVGFYVQRILFNSIVIRLLTFVIMYCKFNEFVDCSSFVRIFYCKKNEHQVKQIEQDVDLNLTIDISDNSDIQIIAENNETQFTNFSKQKIIIGWKNLSLYESSSFFEIGSMNLGRKPKEILRNLNGQFCFGTLNALMGTSGAGKTSLLRVLNGQCKTRVSDSTRFYLSRFTKIETCFITQEVSGHLMPGLTAKQFLVYASRLKNLNSQIDHENVALSVLDKLDLMDTVDTQLVDVRCSGGERKRLALAAELTATVMPNLVCIDEPTSGLDSNSAETVISCLSKLTQLHPITILASIHQPNTSILSMFDQLYVLARGGVCIYSGPPAQVQSHLNQISQISSTNSPIEQLIIHSCSNYQDENVQKLVQLTNQNIEQDVSKLLLETELIPDGVQSNRTRFSLKSVQILLLRYITYIGGYLWKEMIPFALLYVMYGYVLLVFWNPQIAIPSGCVSVEDDFNQTCATNIDSDKLKEDKQINDNLKFNFFMNNLFSLLIMLQAGLTFFREIVYFQNEHRNGWYSAGSYYLTKSIVEIVPIIPIILIYVYVCDIYEQVRPGIYWHLVLITMLSVIACQGLAHSFVLVSGQNVPLITIIFISTYDIFLLLGNFFVNLNRLHYIYRFMSNLTVSRFAFEAMLLLEYGFGRCLPRQIQPILHWMSLTDDHYYSCVLMLIVNLVLYRVVAIVLLIYRMNPNENRRERVARICSYRHKLDSAKPEGFHFSNQLRIKQFSQ